ncbi:MAG: hypothetical protein LBR07_03185 [Puniceicoccales bacterium]|jgi:hypothetical protein|nr:hypothetical protein [Puniceicoccales bacterium]
MENWESDSDFWASMDRREIGAKPSVGALLAAGEKGLFRSVGKGKFRTTGDKLFTAVSRFFTTYSQVTSTAKNTTIHAFIALKCYISRRKSAIFAHRAFLAPLTRRRR